MSRGRFQRLILGRAVLALALFAPAAHVLAADDDLDVLDDDERPKAKQPEATRANHAAADDDAALEEREPASVPAEETPAPAPAAAAPSGPSLYIRPYAGAGIATRSYRRPGNPGVQRLAPSVVPGVGVGLDVIAWPEADFSLAFQLHYQSSLGLTVTERPPFALENEVRARSERVELSIAPGWRLGPLRIAVPIGAIVRTFWPEIHTSLTPGYSLIGPHARVEVTLPLGGRMSLRLGPEVQWITLIDEALFVTGLRSQGIALGGEVMLRLQLSSSWAVGVNYRESHAFVGTTRDVGFQDIERYVTLRLEGTF